MSNLRDRLRLAGVEQKDLAARVGVSEALVSRALRGQRSLPSGLTETAEGMIRERVARAAQALVADSENRA